MQGVDVMVVGQRAEERWRLAAGLDQPAAAAVAPEVATSRLSHPSTSAPDAVVLVVHDQQELAWLATHTTRSARRWVPVVALVAREGLARAASAVGAVAVVCLEVPADELAAQLRHALATVTEPAVVITLDAVRSA